MTDTTTAPAQCIDGDLLADVIGEACPEELTDTACRRIAERTLRILATHAGVTVVSGPDSTPWQPPAHGDAMATAQPVVLTPDDAGDIRRLADALRAAPNWRRDEPGGDVRFAGRVLDQLAADDTVDGVDLAISNRDAEIAADLRSTVMELVAIRDDLTAQRDRALEKLGWTEQQRDEQIAGHVRAHDALAWIRRELARLADECTPDEPTTTAAVSREPTCSYCGRSWSTHQVVRNHRFVHRDAREGRADG